MFRHSPSPWVAGEIRQIGKFEPPSCFIKDSTGLLIARVWHAESTGEGPYNTALIQAAPKLLEALREIAATDDRDRPAKIRSIARIAIAAVTGEP